MICCHDACMLNANVTYRECLPYLQMILETCSQHAPHGECAELLALAEHSSPHAVAFEQCLAARRIVQLGILKFRECDCC